MRLTRPLPTPFRRSRSCRRGRLCAPLCSWGRTPSSPTWRCGAQSRRPSSCRPPRRSWWEAAPWGRKPASRRGRRARAAWLRRIAVASSQILCHPILCHPTPKNAVFDPAKTLPHFPIPGGLEQAVHEGRRDGGAAGAAVGRRRLLRLPDGHRGCARSAAPPRRSVLIPPGAARARLRCEQPNAPLCRAAHGRATAPTPRFAVPAHARQHQPTRMLSILLPPPGGAAWYEFLRLFDSSRLVHATTIDFTICTLLAPFWMSNDAEGRKWEQR